MGRRGRRPQKPEDRFWDKVDVTKSCWHWMGASHLEAVTHSENLRRRDQRRATSKVAA